MLADCVEPSKALPQAELLFVIPEGIYIVTFCHTQIVVQATFAGEVIIHNRAQPADEISLTIHDWRGHPFKQRGVRAVKQAQSLI